MGKTWRKLRALVRRSRSKAEKLLGPRQNSHQNHRAHPLLSLPLLSQFGPVHKEQDNTAGTSEGRTVTVWTDRQLLLAPATQHAGIGLAVDDRRSMTCTLTAGQASLGSNICVHPNIRKGEKIIFRNFKLKNSNFCFCKDILFFLPWVDLEK